MQRALLLDRNYMALSVVSWKKAVKLMVKGKAEPVDMTTEAVGTSVRHATGVFNVPTIIRLLTVIPWRAHQGRMKFSRRNMLVRDNSECQYCGIHVGKHTATVDHVIPRSKGGKTDYLNCVTSCKDCNNKKGDRTPKEAGLRLKKKPRRPTFLMLYRHHLKNPPEEWQDFIIGVS